MYRYLVLHEIPDIRESNARAELKAPLYPMKFNHISPTLRRSPVNRKTDDVKMSFSLSLSRRLSLPRRYSDIKTPYPLPRLILANGNVDFRNTSPPRSHPSSPRPQERPIDLLSSHFTFLSGRFICRDILQSRKSTVISDPPAIHSQAAI